MDKTFSPPDGSSITAGPDEPAPVASPTRHPDAIISGLSAVIAERLGLDPLWVRLAFVLLSLVGGLGLVVYLGLWLVLIVDADGTKSWARVTGGLIIVGGVPFLISETDLGFASGAFAVVALLSGLALALWRTTPQVSPQPAVAGSDRPPPPVADAPPTPYQPTRRVPQPPSILGRLTLGIAVIVASGGALIDELNGGRLHPEQWLGAAAVVCGLGLLLGTVRGTARWLIVPALALGIGGYGAGLLARSGIGLGDIAGERHISIHADSPGLITTAVGFGRLQIDVHEVPLQPVNIEAVVAAGTISMYLADNVAVEVRADLDHVIVHSDGRRVPDQLTFGPARSPDVVVDASLLHGPIRIDTYSTGSPVLFDDPGATIFQDQSAIDQVIVVVPGVGMTPDGWLLLGDREAILDERLNVIVGTAAAESDETTLSIETTLGTYRIVGNVLITPQNEVFDIDEIRNEFADAASPVIEAEPQPGED